MNQPESCKTCKFWRQYNDNAESGECRRFPPIGFLFWCMFPDVDPTEWCGEYVKGEKQ